MSAASTSTQEFSLDEVSRHNKLESVWIIIDHQVYDLTDFVDAHPGGSVVLSQVAGTDVTTTFHSLHRNEILQKYSKKFRIGTIEREKPEIIQPRPGAISEVPYAEPLWLRPEFKSPYYDDSHHRLQKAMRVFVDKEIYPEAQAKEADGTFVSQELINKMAAANILAMRLGPGKHLHGRKLLGDVGGERFDAFHDLVVAQELTRANARGFQDGNMAGMMISLTAARQWLNDQVLLERITNECLSGKKTICLAVSEAFAGSDVAGIQTTASKTADGKHYVVNGTKKWITNGVFADYFVTGCKTENGFLVLLVERGENVTTRPVRTSYSAAAGTAFIQFDNVKVPVNHLLGAEDKGFAVIMSNFNHERWAMVCATARSCRTVVEECLKWSHQRRVSGEPLIAQPVIRQK